MPCPKCGEDTLKPKFIPADTIIRRSQLVPDQEKYTAPGTFTSETIVRSEHLVITCKTCGYGFAAKTKDAE